MDIENTRTSVYCHWGWTQSVKFPPNKEPRNLGKWTNLYSYLPIYLQCQDSSPNVLRGSRSVLVLERPEPSQLTQNLLKRRRVNRTVTHRSSWTEVRRVLLNVKLQLNFRSTKGVKSRFGWRKAISPISRTHRTEYLEDSLKKCFVWNYRDLNFRSSPFPGPSIYKTRPTGVPSLFFSIDERTLFPILSVTTNRPTIENESYKANDSRVPLKVHSRWILG